MEQMEVLDVIKELLETKQYTRLRQKIADMNIADIATVMERLEEAELLKIFRILPKNMAKPLLIQPPDHPDRQIHGRLQIRLSESFLFGSCRIRSFRLPFLIRSLFFRFPRFRIRRL